jgi:hypothetical protein
VLDKIGAVFGTALEGSDIHWDAVTRTADRRDIAPKILRQVPVLWIWDNVECHAPMRRSSCASWERMRRRMP